MRWIRDRGRQRLVKGDFRRSCCGVDVLVEGSVGIMALLLDCGAELEEVLWYFLVRSSKDIDQTKMMMLVKDRSNCTVTAVTRREKLTPQTAPCHAQ